MKTYTEKDFAMEKKGVDKIANATIKKLMGQPKELIYIPSQSNTDRIWEGNINGVRIHIKKDEYVEVPKDVAALIANNTKVLKASEKEIEKYTTGIGAKVGEM